jgi:Fe2+ or Zn2+ uptake regulation protein
MNPNEERIISDIEKEIEKEGKFKPIHISELMDKEFKDTEWIVEKLIPSESITAISGSPATYKTWIILDLALKVAQGDILFDKFTTSQSGILIIDEENGERLTQKRFDKMKKDIDLPIYFLSLSGFKLSEGNVRSIINFCEQNSAKVVIFDSLIRIHSEDENDAAKMSKVFSFLKQFNKHGLSVIFTHHNRKQGAFMRNPSQDMRGSSDILASLDCHLAVERKEGYIVITQTKLRQEQEIKAFKIGVINEENEFRFEYWGEAEETQTKKGNAKEAIKDILSRESKPMYRKEIFEAVKNDGLDIGYKTFENAIKEMIVKEELFEKRGEKNKTYCSLLRDNSIENEVPQNSLSL